MAASAAAQQSARGAMESRSLLLVLSGAFVVFLAAPASGQSFEDPTLFYKNMTFEFDVRHRGEVGIPSCVKQLMECWDIIRLVVASILPNKDCSKLYRTRSEVDCQCLIQTRHWRNHRIVRWGHYNSQKLN
ncbi:uncharacterized protein isoform X2 [Choristoneura fumiferana]|uniref:uncharacterized protein isoform X2 n=1 Tax=Choristoneura fumiferana TaxID=7141 RepID=UPI003D154037